MIDFDQLHDRNGLARGVLFDHRMLKHTVTGRVRPRRISDARLAHRLLTRVARASLHPSIAREVRALIAALGRDAEFRHGDVTVFASDGTVAPGAVRVHLAGKGGPLSGYLTAVTTVGPAPKLLRLRFETAVDRAWLRSVG